MVRSLLAMVSAVRLATRSRSDLLLEIVALCHQLAVYQRQGRQPRLDRGDRLLWIWLRRRWSRWREALVLVRPETVLRWHREGYRAHWRRRSRGKPGRPRIPREHIDFIRRISSDPPEWGEDRIALELKLKLGVEHAASTVRRHRVERGGPRPGSTWRQFLKAHAGETFTLDFATQVLWNFDVRYILVVMALDTSRGSSARHAGSASTTSSLAKADGLPGLVEMLPTKAAMEADERCIRALNRTKPTPGSPCAAGG